MLTGSPIVATSLSGRPSTARGSEGAVDDHRCLSREGSVPLVDGTRRRTVTPGPAGHSRTVHAALPAAAAPASPSVISTPGELEAPALVERYRRLAMASDAASAVAASVVALALRFGMSWPLPYVALTMAVPLGWIAFVGLQRGYEPRFLGTGPEEYRRATTAAMALFILIAVVSYVGRQDVSRAYVLVAVPGLLVLSLGGRHLLRLWIYRLRQAGQGLQRVLVVGRADAAVAVIDKFRQEPQHGLLAVGACVPQASVYVSHIRDVPVVGDPGRILDAVDAVGAHVVAVASHPDLAGQSLRRLSWALEERGVELVVSPGIVEVAGPRLSIRPIAGPSLLHLERPTFGGTRMLFKTVFDRTLGALLLALALPLVAVIALAVRLSGPGPVLFRQVRVGVDGRRFTMLKFRTMVPDAEDRRPGLRDLDDGNGMLFKIRDDPRVTRVGALLRRFSLDELPQLVNVLRGDMSLVGPRPLPQRDFDHLEEWHKKRYLVLPGMTG